MGNFTDSVLSQSLSGQSFGNFTLASNPISGAGGGNYSLISSSATGRFDAVGFLPSVGRDYAMGQLAATGLPTLAGAGLAAYQTGSDIVGAFHEVFAPPPPPIQIYRRAIDFDDNYFEPLEASAVDAVPLTDPHQVGQDDPFRITPYRLGLPGNDLYFAGNRSSKWGSGHHLVPVGVFTDPEFDLPSDVKAVFDEDCFRICGPWYDFHDGTALNGVSHDAYNKEIRTLFQQRLKETGIEGFHSGDARDFANEIHRMGANTRAGQFNAAVRGT